MVAFLAAQRLNNNCSKEEKQKLVKLIVKLPSQCYSVLQNKNVELSLDLRQVLIKGMLNNHADNLPYENFSWSYDFLKNKKYINSNERWQVIKAFFDTGTELNIMKILEVTKLDYKECIQLVKILEEDLDKYFKSWFFNTLYTTYLSSFDERFLQEIEKYLMLEYLIER